MKDTPYQVRAVSCDHRASDEEVYEALGRATAPLSRAWDKLRAARRIVVKFNQDWPKEPPMFEGVFRELVSEKVARATLRLIREANPSAEVCAADVSFFQVYNDAKPGTTTWLKKVFDEFGVGYIDGNEGPIVPVEVPGGGRMFKRYFLSQNLLDNDALVCVQKMKNHAFMGITLCLKNLFGLMTTEPMARPRQYYHHLVRMPYMLGDIGKIFNPALNILDALTAQAGQEWGYGAEKAFITNALVAGDHPIATDAVGATLMGHDPAADWLTPPYNRDRNALLIAAQSGWGTVNLDEIDYQTEVPAPLPGTAFFAHITDPQERVISWRRTTAEQALFYRDHQKEMVGKYAGEYVLIQQNEVRWHDPSGRLKVSRRQIAGPDPDQALWFKFVDPEEIEGENFEIYEDTLKEMQGRYS